ncbi:MAG: hypothetical protein AAF483_04700 [Planctomycetota bacterium]
MTIRIGQYIVAGELRNSRRNSIVGWVAFAPEFGIRIELTGNFPEELRSNFLSFDKAPSSNESDSQESPEGKESNADQNLDPALRGEDWVDALPQAVHDLADRQIGVLGELQVENESDPSRLLIRWFSQNGPVELELSNPILNFVEEDELGEDESESAERYPEDTFEQRGEFNGIFEDDELEDAEDPYGLFDKNLDEFVNGSLEESLGESLLDAMEEGDQPPSGEPEKRPWEEVVPGIDPETKELYEHWDEIFQGDKDEPVTYLFDTALRLPRPDNVQSDEEAQPHVVAILAQLARLSVALDVCEHFSALDTYRLLMEDILPTAKVHPNLAKSDMVQHFSTSDVCRACEAEFDAEYEALNGIPSDADDSDEDSGAPSENDEKNE